MCKNKFLLGELIGVHVSSIVNESIRTISVFFEKTLSTQKCKSSKNQLKKQKQANKIQQRQQFFAHKTSERRKIICFALLKKNWNCLDNLIYYTTYFRKNFSSEVFGWVLNTPLIYKLLWGNLNKILSRDKINS